jgi:hypothetical protein
VTRFVFAVTAALAVAPAFAYAQTAPAPVNGTFVFEQKLMFRDGANAMQEQKGEAHLTLEQKGDSVIGTWQVHVLDNSRTIPPMLLRGTVTDGTVRLRAPSKQAQLQGPDGDTTIETYQEFVLTIRGDEISGAIHTYSTNENIEIPPRDITGKRKA